MRTLCVQIAIVTQNLTAVFGALTGETITTTTPTLYKFRGLTNVMILVVQICPSQHSLTSNRVTRAGGVTCPATNADVSAVD